MLFEKTKINEKEARDGPFKNTIVKNGCHLVVIVAQLVEHSFRHQRSRV